MRSRTHASSLVPFQLSLTLLWPHWLSYSLEHTLVSPSSYTASSSSKAPAFGGIPSSGSLSWFQCRCHLTSQRQPLTSPAPLPYSPNPSGILYHSSYLSWVTLPLRRYLVRSGDICHCHNWKGNNCPLVGRGQGCCSICYKAQDSPPQQRIVWPQMPWLRSQALSLLPFSTALIGTSIDGLGGGGSPLLDRSSLGTGVQGCSLLRPQHLEECQAHLTLPALGWGVHTDLKMPGPDEQMSPEKKSVFKRKTKITFIGQCAYNETRTASHFCILTKLSSQPAVKDWFYYLKMYKSSQV